MTVDGTTTNFAYDAWGRMTSRTRGSLAAQYAWRYGSFLANVTSNFPGEAATVNYVYDGLQNRRLKQVNGTNYTWTRYDANGSALADYSGGAGYWDIGGRQRSFHGGAEIAGSSPQTGTPSYYLRNHLGSIMATTNASKNIVASYQYTPYGEFLSESTTGDHATFGYTGHRLDRELNHYYAKYRYYNPSTMRWLKRDPLGMVDGPNVYAYVGGNVIHVVDLMGLYGLGGYPPPGKYPQNCERRKKKCKADALTLKLACYASAEATHISMSKVLDLALASEIATCKILYWIGDLNDGAFETCMTDARKNYGRYQDVVDLAYRDWLGFCNRKYKEHLERCNKPCC